MLTTFGFSSSQIVSFSAVKEWHWPKPQLIAVSYFAHAGPPPLSSFFFLIFMWHFAATGRSSASQDFTNLGAAAPGVQCLAGPGEAQVRRVHPGVPRATAAHLGLPG